MHDDLSGVDEDAMESLIIVCLTGLLYTGLTKTIWSSFEQALDIFGITQIHQTKLFKQYRSNPSNHSKVLRYTEISLPLYYDKKFEESKYNVKPT